ncbi:MAG TPA: Clp protease N-terminal domain-containing protein [Solirubrobacteraceae bacterium]|nr:Clp protease N-terminal domain-containing protein [Solirubrobacteraceae bacterium]
MFERFSDRARQVVVLAQQEARELGHDYIGTEHILIALLREEVGVPRAMLAVVSLTADEARAAAIAIVGHGEASSLGRVLFTPRATRVLQSSVGEAHSLGRAYVDTEHLLLAMIDEADGIAARILRDAGVDARAIRALANGEIDVDLGWRGRSIALAALGAAVIGRSAFGLRRTGGLAPIDMQLLAFLALGERELATSETGEETASLARALACDLDDVRVALRSLLREGLIADSSGAEADRVEITAEGMARVEQWLRRTASLFEGLAPRGPGRGRRVMAPVLARRLWGCEFADFCQSGCSCWWPAADRRVR